MKFKYVWTKNEANFGKPIKYQAAGGTHITLEIILKYKSRFIALRRESIPGHERPKKSSKDLLFFCHGLIRYGESVDQAVRRLVKQQCGVRVKSSRVVYIESAVQRKDRQWAFIPHIVVDLAAMPKKGIYGNAIKEVVRFSSNKIPNDFAWWAKKDLRDFLREFAK